MVSRSDITLGRQIGMGSSKTVYEGTFGGRQVAVMAMRRGDCLTECSILVRLGRHPHLVRFLAMCPASTSSSSEGGGGDGARQLMVTELAPHGSLLGLFADREEEVTMGHKVIMMQQIAAGMETLAAEKMVHR